MLKRILNHPRWILALSIGIIFGGGYFLGAERYLSLSYLKGQEEWIRQFNANFPLSSIFLFFGLYVFVCALSVPGGATLLTLAAGAFWGLGLGTLIVSFSSSVGACAGLLVGRFLFRCWVEKHFGHYLKTANEGLAKDGKFYLFSLRVIPVFPFFVVNLVLGLTQVKLWPFYWVSQIGMLPGTWVYVNAGTELAKIDSLQGVLSFRLFFAFSLLGIFPWLVKKFLPQKLQARSSHRPK